MRIVVEKLRRTTMASEKIFEYDLDIISVTDYGANMEAIFAGQENVPLQGAQFDVTLAGSIKGDVELGPLQRHIFLPCKDSFHIRALGDRKSTRLNSSH